MPLFFLWVALVFAAKATAQTTSFSTTQQLDQLFQYCYHHHLFNGSVLISRGDSILYQQHYGHADAAQTVALTDDHAFFLASLSKQFTAMGIVYLAHRDQLDYEQPVQAILPQFPYPHITIRQLLQQTSGIPDYLPLLQQQKKRLQEQYERNGTVVDNQTVAQLYAQRKPELAIEPGTAFHYSNTNYCYLALVIEAVSGQSYADFMQTTFFEPLGMTHTAVLQGEAPIAAGFEWLPFAEKAAPRPLPAFFQVYGDGGIYSTAMDLHRWFSALDRGQLLPQSAQKIAYTPAEHEDKPLPYGFGWFVRRLPFNGDIALTHSGSFVGYHTAVFRNLSDHTHIILLSNNSTDSQAALNRALVQLCYGRAYQRPQLSATYALAPRIKAEGVAAAQAFYEKNKAAEQYDFSEKAFNALGYELLKAEHLAEAVAVFEWNVERFPESANVYDSLAEAYLRQGDQKQARHYYQKALERDPSNARIKATLQQLETEHEH